VISFKDFISENYKPEFVLPTKREIVKVLEEHPLIKLRVKVKRAFVVGSFSTGKQHERSDVDIMLEIIPKKNFTSEELEDWYRKKLRSYFMKNDIKGQADHIHPQWCGRRVDLYFTYDADVDPLPKIELK
jgi:predicted nucleotidyltransferase